MFLRFEDRASDLPLVERVWRAESAAGGGRFHSMAEGNLELVVSRLEGRTQVLFRGPVTQPTTVDCPPNGRWFAIRFRLGTYLPRWPTVRLLDGANLELPATSDGRFWLDGATWETPSFETAEQLVTRL